ncbi:MAG: branched-chain-amino-acid transaminase [Nitrososphaeria archaeon]
MSKTEFSSEGMVYINGEFFSPANARISVFDQGFIFGDAVFDTMVVVNGYIFKLDAHLDRLLKSAMAVRIRIPLSRDEIKNAIVETVRKSGLKDAYLKIIVSRGIGKKPILGRGDIPEPTIVIFAVPLVSVVSEEKIEKGAKIISTTYRRPSMFSLDPRIKSTNYQVNMLMRIEAMSKGADEAISYDERGVVSEGGGENIFVVKNGVLMTPKSGILKGITRETVLEIARKLGKKAVETDITKYDLYTADEIFLCSTAGGIIPVTDIDGVNISDGKPGPITKEMAEEYTRMLKEGSHGTPVYEH